MQWRAYIGEEERRNVNYLMKALQTMLFKERLMKRWCWGKQRPLPLCLGWAVTEQKDQIMYQGRGLRWLPHGKGTCILEWNEGRALRRQSCLLLEVVQQDQWSLKIWSIWSFGLSKSILAWGFYHRINGWVVYGPSPEVSQAWDGACNILLTGRYN